MPKNAVPKPSESPMRASADVEELVSEYNKVKKDSKYGVKIIKRTEWSTTFCKYVTYTGLIQGTTYQTLIYDEQDDVEKDIRVELNKYIDRARKAAMKEKEKEKEKEREVNTCTQMQTRSRTKAPATQSSA